MNPCTLGFRCPYRDDGDDGDYICTYPYIKPSEWAQYPFAEDISCSLLDCDTELYDILLLRYLYKGEFNEALSPLRETNLKDIDEQLVKIGEIARNKRIFCDKCHSTRIEIGWHDQYGNSVIQCRDCGYSIKLRGRHDVDTARAYTVHDDSGVQIVEPLTCDRCQSADLDVREISGTDMMQMYCNSCGHGMLVRRDP